MAILTLFPNNQISVLWEMSSVLYLDTFPLAREQHRRHEKDEVYLWLRIVKVQLS